MCVCIYLNQDLALNNLQVFMYLKTQLTNQNEARLKL